MTAIINGEGQFFHHALQGKDHRQWRELYKLSNISPSRESRPKGPGFHHTPKGWTMKAIAFSKGHISKRIPQDMAAPPYENEA